MSLESEVRLSESMKVFLQKDSLCLSEESLLKGLSFKPRKSDVLIVSPGKCGSTWMQQIVHQLRTGGDMEFNDIYEVIPLIERAHDFHLDLEADQRGYPRAFKSHSSYDKCPKGGKYIVIFREPCAAAYSFFKYVEGWYFQPGEIKLEEFVTQFWLNLQVDYGNYFPQLSSWWKCRKDPNVLFLFFEEMKEDRETVVKSVASFLGIKDQERIQNAVRMSSFDFMKANSTKFEENLFSKYRNHVLGLPDGASASKVATGRVDLPSKVMPEHVKKAIQEKWINSLTNELGYQTYDELRTALRNEIPLKTT